MTQLWLFDLAGRVARHVRKDDLVRALIARQLAAVFIDLFFGAAEAWLAFDDGRGDLAEAAVRQPDHRDVLDRVMAMEEIFDLYRIDGFAAGDDDIFLAVDQVDEALFILLGHIAGIQPAIFQYFGRGLGVIVVTSHDAGAFYAQLAD